MISLCSTLAAVKTHWQNKGVLSCANGIIGCVLCAPLRGVVESQKEVVLSVIFMIAGKGPQARVLLVQRGRKGGVC